ncbi:hypothetical protein [Thiocapsa rosea]|uniref:hypothetical protein n=1 Tax=Thiocapsa rosea TaxID=69360 RepID=UPI000EB40B24|nr:hypothetical protein [Thiocapsa rosea]
MVASVELSVAIGLQDQVGHPGTDDTRRRGDHQIVDREQDSVTLKDVGDVAEVGVGGNGRCPDTRPAGQDEERQKGRRDPVLHEPSHVEIPLSGPGIERVARVKLHARVHVLRGGPGGGIYPGRAARTIR